MMRTLFLPETIRDYYVFRKRIASFFITQTHISALYISCNGIKKEITNSLLKQINYEGYETSELAIIAALSDVIVALGTCDKYVVVVNSTYAIFKELTVPLLDEEKIEQILGFELEQYLPFSSQDAVFDSIVTHQDFEKKQSDVFAVAIPQQKINDIIALFSAAHARVDTATVDPFMIYSLYKKISKDYVFIQKAQLLVAGDEEKTTLLYLQEGILKKIRILQEKPVALHDQWWNEIRFTFESCTQEWVGQKELIFLGSFDQEFITKSKLFIHSESSHISIETIIKQLAITISSEITIQSLNLTTLAAALELPITVNFNISPFAHTLINSQRATIYNYITAGTLLVLLYGSFGVHTFLEVQKFSQASAAVKDKTLKEIKQALPVLKTNSLPEALRKAKSEISKEEDIWYSFSSQTRHSFLTYLFDLSTAIDRDVLSLDLKKMTFNKNGIVLEGKVLNFEAVEELIKQLRQTNLFVQVPNLQKTEFIMPLTLVSQGNQ